MFFRLMELECSLISHRSEPVATICRVAPDVLIVDLDLEDLRGVEIANQVRAAMPDLPIIFLSASAARPPFEAPVVAKPHGRFEGMLRLFEAVLATEA